MHGKRLFWQLYLAYLAITLLGLAVLVLCTWSVLPQFGEGLVPKEQLGRIARDMQLRVGAAAVFVALLTAGVGLLLCRRIARPFEELRSGAERFSRGELSFRVPPAELPEAHAISRALNYLADTVTERNQVLDSERNQRDAILTSMVEGVLAVDANQRLISLNRAGAALLGIDRARAPGRSLQEVVRNAELQELLTKVLDGEQTQLAEITLHGKEDCILEAHGTVLRAAGGQKLGALAVLHNVTQLRRLERVRRDFVANVSHELKTPVTSIKGFVETLLDGAMDSPEDATRFLQIVAAQTDRLAMIIEDLLTLSRMEQEAEQEAILLEPSTIRHVLDAAVAVCQTKAENKEIHLAIDCDPDLLGMVNPLLLEQAVVNLVDNAVKYSPAQATIELIARKHDADIAIEVRDHGCGIGREHLARIFERFYRVDKARSRSLGGTGLGLAIVKHIAQAHGGRATVESTPGKGSTFTIHVRAA